MPGQQALDTSLPGLASARLGSGLPTQGDWANRCRLTGAASRARPKGSTTPHGHVRFGQIPPVGIVNAENGYKLSVAMAERTAGRCGSGIRPATTRTGQWSKTLLGSGLTCRCLRLLERPVAGRSGSGESFRSRTNLFKYTAQKTKPTPYW
jgi:hypothetical protein